MIRYLVTFAVYVVLISFATIASRYSSTEISPEFFLVGMILFKQIYDDMGIK